MTNLDHWHPYLPPIEWLRLWRGAGTWQQRDRDTAARVILAAELMSQDNGADAAAHALAGTRAEVHHSALIAVYFLAASFAVSPGRDALLADLASDAGVVGAEVLALADAIADYLPDTEATEIEQTGLYLQMKAVSSRDSAPILAHLMVAVRLLGLLWRDRPGTFDDARHAYGKGWVA